MRVFESPRVRFARGGVTKVLCFQRCLATALCYQEPLLKTHSFLAAAAKTSKSVVLRNLCSIFYCFVSRRSGPGRSRSGPRSAACPVRVALVEQAPGPPPVFGTRHRPGLGRLQRHGDVLREGLPLGGGAAVASRGAVDGGFTREKRGI